MIIIHWWSAQGNEGQCNSNCYRLKPADRAHNSCACVCAGDNHGIGRKAAWVHTRLKAPGWIREFDDKRPADDKIVRWTVTPSAVTHMRRMHRCFDDPRFFFTTNEHYIPKQVDNGV